MKKPSANRKIYRSIVCFFFLSSILSSCREVLEDPLTGTYEGTSSFVETRYPCHPCEHLPPTLDSGTASVRFTVERDRNQRNQYIIYGLSRLERGFFSADEYHLVPGNRGFTIFTQNPGGNTKGEATLKGNSIRLDFTHTYRNRQQVYQVKARKLY